MTRWLPALPATPVDASFATTMPTVAPPARPPSRRSGPRHGVRLWASTLLLCLAGTCAACQAAEPDAVTVVQSANTSAAGATTTPAAEATPAVLPTSTETATREPGSLPTNSATTQSEATPSPTASPSATAVPEASETAAPALEARIEWFTAMPATISPGDSIELAWSTTGGVVTLYRIGSRGQPEPLAMELPASGTYVEQTSDDVRRSVDFLLVIRPSATANEWLTQANASVTVDRECDQWFFAPEPQTCAEAAVQGDAAYQRFEHGFMIWFGPEAAVYVFYDDPKIWQWHRDKFGEGDAESDPSIQPPSGMLQPVRGFGLVWRTDIGPGTASVREALGWALSPEEAYTATLQCDNLRREMYTRCYLAGPRGEVYEVTGSGPWTLWQ